MSTNPHMDNPKKESNLNAAASRDQAKPRAPPFDPRSSAAHQWAKLDTLMGFPVLLTTRTSRFEGVLARNLTKSGTAGAILKNARDVKNVAAPVQKHMFIPLENILSCRSTQGSSNINSGSAFATQSSLQPVMNGNQDTDGLTSSAGTNSGQSPKLSQPSKQMDSAMMSSNEEGNTNYNTPEFKEWRRMAEIIIRGSITNNANHPDSAEERGAPDNESGMHKEDKYAFATRRHSMNISSDAMRAVQTESHVPPSPTRDHFPFVSVASKCPPLFTTTGDNWSSAANALIGTIPIATGDPESKSPELTVHGTETTTGMQAKPSKNNFTPSLHKSTSEEELQLTEKRVRREDIREKHITTGTVLKGWWEVGPSDIGGRMSGLTIQTIPPFGKNRLYEPIAAAAIKKGVPIYRTDYPILNTKPRLKSAPFNPFYGTEKTQTWVLLGEFNPLKAAGAVDARSVPPTWSYTGPEFLSSFPMQSVAPRLPKGKLENLESLSNETETSIGTPADCSEKSLPTILQRQRGSFEIVSSKMSLQDMFNCLMDHGCLDLSSQIDPSVQFRTPIAGGAFGDVYRGSLRDGTIVAIKALRYYLLSEDTAPKALKRAMRELYYWSKLKHDNVQELLGVIMLEGRLGVVSLWMPNGHLEEYLRKNPDANRLKLSIQIASGVEYLHSIDMVHGDLKARNVLVDQNGIARISDFDHSILSSCTLGFTDTTNAGGGTVRWMAPELFLSDEEAGTDSVTRTKQTDVYALGMTMLEIITGEHPYAEYRVDRGIILALAKGKYPTRPKGLKSNRMWALLEDCWNYDRTARVSIYAVCKELSTLGPEELQIGVGAEE